MARLLHRLRQGEFTVTVEIDPPRSADATGVLNAMRRWADRVDAINVADCPMANVRMSPITLAHLVQREFQVECIFHLTARDRNLIGLQAELLGAAGLGVRNILCLRGDNPQSGDQPDAAGVFQVDAVGLIGLANGLNHGCTAAGRPLEIGTEFAIGCAANPGAAKLDQEVDRLLAKVEAGAHFAQTQPVYDPGCVFRFQEHLAARGLQEFPVLYGIMPLRSLKNAMYLRDNVPGIQVPDAVITRMQAGEAGAGVQIAGEVVAAIGKHVHGVHIFPMNTSQLVEQLLDILAELGLRRPHPALAALAAARHGGVQQGA